jgi:hypothetical protein
MLRADPALKMQLRNMIGRAPKKRQTQQFLVLGQFEI